MYKFKTNYVEVRGGDEPAPDSDGVLLQPGPRLGPQLRPLPRPQQSRPGRAVRGRGARPGSC